MSRRVQPLSNVCKVTSSLSFWTQTNSLIGNRLPPVNTVKNENEKCNKEALLVPPHQRLSAFYLFNLMVYFESGGDKSLIGNWPDNDDLIKKLAETVYLGDIRIVDLNVFDAQGSRIHAAKLGEHLVPGTRVAVLLDPKMFVFTSINLLSFFFIFSCRWDITTNSNGDIKTDPSRHCVSTIEELYIIPETEDEIRDSIHHHLALKRLKATQEREDEHLAEQHRQTLINQEAARLLAQETKDKEIEARKAERAERLKSLWRSPPSCQTVTASLSVTSSPASPEPGPSSSKRYAIDDPPSTPSPPKRRSAPRMSTGGKAPSKKLTQPSSPPSPSPIVTRSSRIKGKGKVVERMDEMLTTVEDKGKGKATDEMEIDDTAV